MEPSFPEVEVPGTEVQFEAVRSPRELAPTEPSLLDNWFPEEVAPECLSAVALSPPEPTPAGWSVVVQLDFCQR